MTRLEIATQIFCSGKADNLELAYKMAGDLISLDIPSYQEIKGITFKVSSDSDKTISESFTPIVKDKFDEQEVLELLKARTERRTQQVIDLGFEWKEKIGFINNTSYIYDEDIEKLDDDEWNELISKHDPTTTLEEAVQVIDEAFPTESNESPTIDFFRGKDYIEFEMDKSICRLYKESNKLISEEDLQVTKKTESKFILANSDNEEYQLGITIYKK